jgi:hypothetical protein
MYTLWGEPLPPSNPSSLRPKSVPERKECGLFHRWEQLFSRGTFVCLDCGIQAVCPECIASYVPNAAPFIHYCSTHDTKRRGEQS